MKNNNLYLGLIIILSVSIGYLLGSNNIINSYSTNSDSSSFKKLNRLIKYLTQDYVDEINSDSLVNIVIKEIVNKLDPHSVFIPAVQRESLSESMKGNFYGIGVQFRMLQDTVAVSRVLKGGPSEKAGLLSGDRILMADEDTLFQKELNSDQIISRLKGNSKTPVRLSVYRKKEDSIYSFDIVRGPVPLPSVNALYMMDEITGYIKITRFSQTTYPEFKNAITFLKAKKMKRLIIDLRGNPGGYLQPAKKIADDLLEAEKGIVIVEANNGKRVQTFSTSGGLFEKGELLILVDEDSASASEVVAGAVQDNDRGLIIGRRTFGKGLVQRQMPLGQGDQVRLTTARYYTPTGRSIQRPYDSSSRTDYYAEVRKRHQTGEMNDPSKIPINDSLIFTTPKGKIVYGGGGITPDIYVSTKETKDELWNDYIIGSNIIDLFVFLELDKNVKNFNFDNKQKFLSEELPNPNQFIDSFAEFCKKNNLPIKVTKKNKENILNSIKAFIALQVYDENTYFKIANQNDKFVIRAMELD